LRIGSQHCLRTSETEVVGIEGMAENKIAGLVGPAGGRIIAETGKEGGGIAVKEPSGELETFVESETIEFEVFAEVVDLFVLGESAAPAMQIGWMNVHGS